MSNITREYALELAELYGIKVNENSNEHLVEDIDGNITELKEQDISEIFGIDFEANTEWYNTKDSEFSHYNVNEQSISIKFDLEDNMHEFTAEELKGVA